MIGIIGYGRFGRLAAGYLSRDTDVFVCSRKKIALESSLPRVHPTDFSEVCRQKIVIPAVPISSFQEMLQQMSPLLQPGSLVIDVCSVKTLPAQWMAETLPEAVSILATHPMFGPDSASQSLAGMKIALCRVRIDEAPYTQIKSYLTSLGLEVIETTPENHDRQIAVSLSLTHFIGRALAAFGAAPLDIDTEGYKRLLHILGVVEHDTWQLFVDMHRYNPYAQETRNAFLAAMQQIESELSE